MEEKNNGKIVDLSQELLEILKEIKEGYKEALGLNLSWRQTSYILANKIKSAGIKFKFP